jgi:soluble P-type ATPase
MTEKNLTVLKFSLDVKPNPFTKHTTVHYTVPISGKISLKLYNSIGRLIEIVNDIYLNAGIYTSTLSTKSLAKGIYFLKYEDNTNQKEIKLIVE